MTKIEEIKTIAEHGIEIKNMDALKEYIGDGNRYKVLAWLSSYVALGEYEDGEFRLLKGEPRFEEIESMRIFDEKQEIYLFRALEMDSAQRSEILLGRKIIDKEDEGQNISVKDVDQVFLGTRLSKNKDGFVTLREDRGFEVTIPESWVENWLNPDKENKIEGSKLILKTRNYLMEWDNGQLSYGDHRFVGIRVEGGKK